MLFGGRVSDRAYTSWRHCSWPSYLCFRHLDLASNSWQPDSSGLRIVDGKIGRSTGLKIVFIRHSPYRMRIWRLPHSSSRDDRRRLRRCTYFAAGAMPRQEVLFDGFVDDRRDKADTDPGRRCARPQYLGIPAGEDRCDRRTVGDRKGGTSLNLFGGPTCSKSGPVVSVSAAPRQRDLDAQLER